MTPLIKKKNIQQKKSRKSKSPEAIAKFKQLRRESKILIAKKKIEHANKMKIVFSKTLNVSGHT
jgi:hypothetical protein